MMGLVRRPRAGWLGPLLALMLALGGPAAACTPSTSSGAGDTGGSEVLDAVQQLPATFYQGTSAEPGAPFDLATVRAVTADPLQSVVVADLKQTAAQKSPETYYRYSDVQVLSGSCSGQGDNRVCELRVQRVYDVGDTGSGQSKGARHDTRVFRAKPVGNEWKLFDTQVETPSGLRWLTELPAGAAGGAGGTAPPGG